MCCDLHVRPSRTRGADDHEGSVRRAPGHAAPQLHSRKPLLPAAFARGEIGGRLEARRSLRARVHDIMFQHDSPAERAFDGALVSVIVLSVIVVILDSVPEINARYGRNLLAAE